MNILFVLFVLRQAVSVFSSHTGGTCYSYSTPGVVRQSLTWVLAVLHWVLHNLFGPFGPSALAHQPISLPDPNTVLDATLLSAPSISVVLQVSSIWFLDLPPPRSHSPLAFIAHQFWNPFPPPQYRLRDTDSVRSCWKPAIYCRSVLT